jgi:hypothetical protein
MPLRPPPNIFTRQHHNPMHMIGHHHKLINIHTRIALWQFIPHLLHHPSGLGQPHLPVHDLPQQAFPILRAHRHEIRPRLGIIIPAKADGTPAVPTWIVPHRPLLVVYQSEETSFAGNDPVTI